VIVRADKPPLMSFAGWFAVALCIAVEMPLIFLRLRSAAEITVYVYFAVVGTVLAAIDIATYRLPDWLTLPSYPIVVVTLSLTARWAGPQSALVRAVQAIAVALVLFLVLCTCTQTGLGDLKYSGLVALVLGARGWGPTVAGFVIAWALAAAWGVCMISRGRAGSRIPLGPFLTAGALLALLWS
jgi:leader peptidase (prepilin peptidase) / N-methyltransferase